MSAMSRFLRCTPGLSLIALLVFLEYALGIFQYAYVTVTLSTIRAPLLGDQVLLGAFAIYSLLLHVASFYFPLRLCSAAWTAARKIEETHREDDDDQSTQIGTPVDDDSIKSLDLNYVDKQDVVPVIMAVVIPTYKEDLSVMEDTLSVLASHPMARESYHIFLAMEERDPNAERTANKLLSMYDRQFLRIQYTVHPVNIPGEAPGKSSNVSWAAKEVERFYSGQVEFRNVLVTTMDSDTHLLPQYFQCLRDAHHRNRKSGYLTDMTLYMPPIVFDRNAHAVPCLVRVADLMWCGAGLSCFLSRSTPSSVAIPTAVYTIPLTLAHLVGGWDTGPGAIGEDMHMMLKCYFATNGRMRIESIPSPASQCNITTELKGIRGWFAGHNARYNQGLRHMWGCLDTGFALDRWLNPSSKTSANNSPTMGPNDHSVEKLATRRPRKLSHTKLSMKLSQYALHGDDPNRLTWRNVVLFSRLFEAHFLPAHLLIMMVASTAFPAIAAASPSPLSQSSRVEITAWIPFCIQLTGYIRATSYLTMVLFFVVIYERYHKACLTARRREMHRSGLYAQLQQADQFSHRRRSNVRFWPDYFLFPVAGTLFGSFCLVQAAFSHFWTDKLVYLVSAKPVRVLLSATATTTTTTTINKLDVDVDDVDVADEKMHVRK